MVGQLAYCLMPADPGRRARSPWEVLHAAGVEHLHGERREAALRELRRAFHVSTTRLPATCCLIRLECPWRHFIAFPRSPAGLRQIGPSCCSLKARLRKKLAHLPVLAHAVLDQQPPAGQRSLARLAYLPDTLETIGPPTRAAAAPREARQDAGRRPHVRRVRDMNRNALAGQRLEPAAVRARSRAECFVALRLATTRAAALASTPITLFRAVAFKASAMAPRPGAQSTTRGKPLAAQVDEQLRIGAGNRTADSPRDRARRTPCDRGCRPWARPQLGCAGISMNRFLFGFQQGSFLERQHALRRIRLPQQAAAAPRAGRCRSRAELARSSSGFFGQARGCSA